MRKRFLVAAAAAAVLSGTALAAPPQDYNPATPVDLGAGVVGGTVFGVGVAEGWWGASAAAALPATAAGAAALGGVAGMGTVAMVDAAIQPCQGFQAMFGLNKDVCVGGRYVGYAPPPTPRRHVVR